jgi:hypothetical protein
MKTFITTLLIVLSATVAQAQLIGSKEKAFTENKRLQYEYMGIGYSDVQFYISSAITMKRELPKAVLKEGANHKGRVAFENGKQYIYFELKEGSYCVFESISDDQSTMTMRFGQDQDETIRFTLKKGVGSDQNQYYVIDAPEKKVSFLGYEWDLLSWDGARLEVKEKSNTKVKVDMTKSKGMKIDGTEKKGILDKVKGN